MRHVRPQPTIAVSILLCLAAATAWAEGTSAPPAKGEPISFVACPIVRDTKTVPCWLAEYEGELYYLGIQVDISADWYPPQHNHEVLVEGRVSDEPRICGGIVIKPIKTSVLPEVNRECNTLWPAEEQYTVPFAPRGPGPANRGLDREAMRRSRLPLPPAPPPPYATREFTVYFDFDTHLMPGGRPIRIVGDAVRYATAAKAKRVEVVGYRATSRLSNGQDLVEMPQIAERRANMVGTAFREAGIPESALTVKWKSEPEPGNGVDDPLRRRVTIRVIP